MEMTLRKISFKIIREDLKNCEGIDELQANTMAFANRGYHEK